MYEMYKYIIILQEKCIFDKLLLNRCPDTKENKNRGIRKKKIETNI